MDWVNVVGLAVVGLVITFIALRIESGRGWLVVVLLIVPTALVVMVWASLSGHWDEVVLAAVVAAVLSGAWWLAGGRRLPRPSSDNIKVWGQETAPKIKQAEAVELQAEVLRLREERQRLEAELRHLRGGNGKDEGSG